ncbi:hypothetical protein CC78DRAFT_13316 [Lojkania enalia]|uniref:Uncharacterized protein n=1 Tax=Lojkania enalia TaxID=147567 RepID=A0A9P4TS76_9PLEO|nr:hypothetical protein CC78DRAFT_13316 [Didymosphaeria enalia]
MRVQSLIRAQSLTTVCLRNGVRTTSRTHSRCALSTAAIPRMGYNGSTNHLRVDNSHLYGQRRQQSQTAAAVCVLLSHCAGNARVVCGRN